MDESIDPARDSATAFLAARTIALYAGQPIHKLRTGDLDLLWGAVNAMVSPLFRERDRRKHAPRGAARLRLVAEDGELTDAGRRVVNGRKGGRATARARRAAAVTR